MGAEIEITANRRDLPEPQPLTQRHELLKLPRMPVQPIRVIDDQGINQTRRWRVHTH
jgi:hypothetical protein